MRINAKQIVLFQLIYTIFIVQWISSVNNMPILPFIADGINCVIVLLLLRNETYFKEKSIIKIQNIVIVVLLFEVLMGVIQFVDNGLSGIALMLWSIRIFYRPFLIFFAVYRTFTKKDIIGIENLIMPVNVIHVILSAVQFYFQGIRWDNNGGIFGTASGCNGYVNIFYCLLFGYILTMYFYEKTSLIKVIIILVSALLSSYWSELKVMYIEIAMIAVVVAVLTKKNIKNTLIIVVATILMINLYPKIIDRLPSNFQQLTSFEALIDYSKNAYNETGKGYISRGEGLEIISEEIFDNSISEVLLGTGLGGGNQISSIGIESLIHQKEGWRRYEYFSIMFLYLETGVFGVLAYFGIFLFMIKRYFKIRRREYTCLGIITICITIFNFWYNSAWTTDGTSYMLALFMVIPFILEKSS